MFNHPMLTIWARKYLTQLEKSQEIQETTINNYRFYLNRFLFWTRLNKINELNLRTIDLYRQWLENQKTAPKKILAKSTINYHLIALRRFLNYLNKNNQQTFPANQIKLNRLPNTIVTTTLTDLEKLLRAPLQTNQEEIIKARDKAILELLFCSGLRISELVNLKIKSFNLNEDKFIISNKFGKPRTVYLSNQARYWLKKYQSLRHDSSSYLFIRHDRAVDQKNLLNLTPRSIQRLIQNYFKTTDMIQKVTPRIIRQTLAKHLIQEGTQIENVAAILGHQSVLTTRKYKELTPHQNSHI